MRRFLPLIALLVVALGSLAFATPSYAQLLPGTGSAKASQTGLETLLEEARRDGSTVIVVQPKKEISVADNSAMRANNFLQARAKLDEIGSSASTFWSALKSTFEASRSNGSHLWILRAFGTVLFGVLLARFFTGRTFRWIEANSNLVNPGSPSNTADKIQYLLVRTVLAVILVGLAVATCFVVAIIFDSGHEPTRRLIFELIVANAVYRFVRHGISWNLFAGAMPEHRLVNLSDEEAQTVHRDWQIGAGLAVIFVAIARFFSFTAQHHSEADAVGVLNANQILLLQIASAIFVTLLILLVVIKNWKTMQHIVAPRESSATMFKLRTGLAKLFPAILIAYSIIALGSFIFRLALGQDAPGVVLGAPFMVGYLAILVYGIVLIVIQAFYNRRERIFRERYELDKARHSENVSVKDEETGEEMIVSQVAMPEFEFQPGFRDFFEKAALAIIIAFGLGELGRIWGAKLDASGGWWSSFLEIGLAAILCWLAYRAVSVFIDRRLQEEGGMPEGDEEEVGGEGGGAGATRMATLLPIMRYVMMFVVFSVAGMVILSKLGFDIGPIFAGAGVVGIAVGFGAQTLIRDIFSGAFFLMDDAFRKGEYLDVEGTKGTVEKISIRSFQLRHHLGALHTLPFGEIKQLTNFSRDWVMMKLPLRVTYDTDVEKVRKLVKKLGVALLDHPAVGHTFMQPLKSQGVYKMEDSAMIIRVKFMTKPGEQFVTRKVVYESIQDLFAREGIHFAHKEVTVRLADGKDVDALSEDEKQAVSAAARSVIDAEAEELAAQQGGKGGGSER